MTDKARRTVGQWVTIAILGIMVGLALTMGTGCDLEQSALTLDEEFYPQESYYGGGGGLDAGDVLETYLGSYVVY